MASTSSATLPQHIKSLRLQYLPFRAMAETTRFILEYGNIPYEDEVVYGQYFNKQRASGAFPFDKVPAMTVEYATPDRKPLTVAQSGSLARFAAQLAGCFTTPACAADPAWQAYNDSIFELGQEMCTVNPTLNCYTGKEHENMKRMYLTRQFLPNVNYLERQLREVVVPYVNAAVPPGQPVVDHGDTGVFFGGKNTPSYADFNVFHHVDNAETLYHENILSMLEEQVSDADFSLGFLKRWMGRMRDPQQMEDNGRFAAYLAKRPKVVDKGQDPGLQDRNGRIVRQRTGAGRVWLKDGLFFDTLGDPSVE